jgi:2-hydroxychromene-2-carboxylate isomerase
MGSMINTTCSRINRQDVRRPVVRPALAAVVLCALLAVPLQATDLIDRVLAVVSGSILTLSDARAAIDLGLVDVRGSRDPIATALTWLIERTLILDEAMRYDPVEPDGAAVDEAVLVARQHVGPESVWAPALDRLGLTDESVRTLIRDSLYAQQYVDRRFETPFPATEDDLRGHYDQHRDSFVQGGRPVAFDDVRVQVADQVQRSRRASARAEWVSRLRRRADVSELYLPGR